VRRVKGWTLARIALAEGRARQTIQSGLKPWRSLDADLLGQPIS